MTGAYSHGYGTPDPGWKGQPNGQHEADHDPAADAAWDHATETLEHASKRCDAYTRVTGERCHVFDGRWKSAQFFHLIPDRHLADSDLPSIVYTSEPWAAG